ncbi:MAG: potassium channel protein [Polyangiales bacterium]
MRARQENTLLRLIPPLLVLGAIMFVGAAALTVMSGGRWGFWQSAYFAIICASTVGFGELPEMDRVPGSRAVSTAIIILGLSAVWYFQSALTTVLVEGVLGQTIRQRRMQRRIAELHDHIIVCGAGSTGRHVVRELVATRTPFVVIEHTIEAIDVLSEELEEREILHVLGDATHDAVLQAAGVTRARGVVAALTEDKDNLYVALSVRDLNANARIVVKVVTAEAEHKMLRAGANATVSPNRIGGMRMASEMLRPTAVKFLDRMLQAKGGALRVEELPIAPTSWFVGKALKDLPIRTQTNALVVAIQEADDFRYNPDPSTIVKAGQTLVLIAEVSNIEKLRALARRESPP